MPIIELNHNFVRANDLEWSRRFHCEALGFEEMSRPAFPFPDHWLGVGGRIQVHMGPHGIPDSDLYYLGTTPKSATDDAGIVDHIAFLASEPGGPAQRLGAIGPPVRKRYFPEIQLFQMFVKDPDGLTIELNFPNTEVEPSLGEDDAIEHWKPREVTANE